MSAVASRHETSPGPEPSALASPRIVPEPAAVGAEEVRRSLDATTQAVFVRRVRTALLLTLASYGLFLAHDLVVRQAGLPSLLLIKVVQVVGAAAMLVALRDPRVARRPAYLALGGYVFIAATATVSAIVRGNTTAHVLLLVALTIGTATLYPWGVRAQAAVVGVSLALLGVNFYAVEGTVVALVADPNVAALLTAMFISLYIAHDGEQYRWQIEEDALTRRLREEYFRSLIEHGADLIVVIDAGGTLRSLSDSAQRFLGDEARVGTPLLDLVHPEDAAEIGQLIAAGGAPAPAPRAVEVRVRDRSGGWRVLLGTFTDLLAHPAVQGLVFNARDITSRKQMETDLRRSEAALSALFESTTDSVWAVDRECRLTAMNAAMRDAFTTLFGRPVYLGQSFEERTPPALAPEWRRLYDRAFAGERVTSEQSFEVDGTLRHYLISMNPIREGEEISGAVVFSRDITELRQAVDLARRNQADLTHVLRLGTMGEIASGLAHEINQPLGAISNYAAACGRWLASGSESKADFQRALELISREAVRAGEIIRRLRDLARKGPASMQLVDLNALVRNAVSLIEPEARVQTIAIGQRDDDTLPPVYVDPIQIEQVVLNLLLNALEAMQSSSQRVLGVVTERSDGCVRVTVRDTGGGLDPLLAERVFEPFFTTKGTGLGMGLAISRRIVEAHGGRLTGGPNEGGCGSTFSFTLPLPS